MRGTVNARVWRRAALAAVCLVLVLVSHEPAGRLSLAAFAGAIDARGFRTLQPRLAITDQYRRFKIADPDWLSHLSPDLMQQAKELLDQEKTSSSPHSIYRAGLTYLLLGKWNDAIEHLSRSGVKSDVDLASALYMRGLTAGSLNDSVRALQLLADAGDSPAAVFNRALVLEAVCDPDAAAAEWQKYLSLDPDSNWAAEAREHLRRDTQAPAWRVWKDEKPKLIAAAMAGDIRRLEVLVDAHRYSARKLIELELLPAWGAAWLDCDDATSRRDLAAARSIASILQSRTGESLTRDAVDEIDRSIASDPSRAWSIAEAFVTYRRGRLAIDKSDYVPARQDLDRAIAAVPPDSVAAALFSPAAVTARYYMYDWAGANELIDRTEAVFAGRSQRYIALFGHMSWLRGLIRVGGGDASAALGLYARALAAFERLGDLEPIAGQHTNMADSYKLLGDWERAAFHRQKALSIAETLDETRRLHPILSDSAGAALAAGFPAAALSFQNRLVRLSRESGEPLRIADSLIIRSTIFTQLNRRAEALRDLAEAPAVVRRVTDSQTQKRLLADLASAEAFADRGVDDSRAVDELTRALDLSSALGFRVHIAQLLLERGRARLRLGDARRAEKDFRAGIADLEHRRRTVQQPDLRISYFDRAETLFTDLAVALLRRGDSEEAFDLLERGRARELLDTTAGLPAEPQPVRSIQRRLRADTRLVTFSATSSGFITAVVSSNSLRIFENSFEAAELERALGENKAPDLRRLGELLLSPLDLEKDARVVLIPDPSLHGVPFAALIDHGKHFVENHIIQFAPSATLAVCRTAPAVSLASRRDATVLLVASKEVPAAYPSLAPLDYAVREAQRVARLYPNHRLLLGSDPDAASLLTLGRGCDVINFGGHAIVNERQPQESCLLVGRNGRISAAEIEAARLPRTSLVVLGGCSTSVGEAHRGEGILSLARAFLAAGVPSVLGTIAPIDDRPGGRMLVAFHTAYASGLDPAAALQRAQLELLRGNDPQLADPKIWAAFQVVSLECGRLTQREENAAWASR